MIIRINNRQIDIDNKTTIGLTIGTYDISKPATHFVTISNNFTIPKTANNLAAIGFAGNAYYFSNLPYEPLFVTIFEKNEVLLYNAKARIQAINDRIELLIYKKEDIWDILKSVSLADEVPDILNWLRLKRGVNTSENKFSGSFASFLAKYADATNGLILPYTFSTQYPDNEIIGTQVYKNTDNTFGAHTFMFLSDFFLYLRDEYDVDFSQDIEFGGNIFQDEYFLSSIVFLPNVIVRYDAGYYFDVATEGEIKDINNAADELTLYSFVEATLKMFNIIIDYGFYEGEYKYRLYRFDKLVSEAPLIDWSEGISKIVEWRPMIENVKQTNLIKYKAVPEGFSENYSGKFIECKNKNIDASGTLIEIPCYAFGFVNDSGIYIPNLSFEEAYKNIVIAILTSTKLSVLCKYESNTTNIQLAIPSLYDLDNEYNVLAGIYEYPQQWLIEKWLKINDIANFRNFATYYIDVLGACFLVSKIDGFSLTKETPTKVTLVKISDKTIKKETESKYWVDGIGNIFSDGLNVGFEYN